MICIWTGYNSKIYYLRTLVYITFDVCDEYVFEDIFVYTTMFLNLFVQISACIDDE